MSNARPDSRALNCITCGRPFLLDETDWPPFCSQRCKMIDLGRWLEEEIEMPHEGGPKPGDIVDSDGIESEPTNSQL
jgi:endogenous inhibitor of DNA gyrase (YacG/DUF329 family)